MALISDGRLKPQPSAAVEGPVRFPSAHGFLLGIEFLFQFEAPGDVIRLTTERPFMR